MAYVGAATSTFSKRIGGHKRVIEKFLKGRPLSDKEKSLCLYKHFCHHDIPHDSSYKLLAVFDEFVEQKYVYLFEGIFMVLLRTFYLRFTGKMTTQSSFDLFNEVCESTGVNRRIFGLNEAWCLRQPCPHPAFSKPSPRRAPGCGDMTYPNGMSDKKGQKDRRPFVAGKPEMGFICDACASFKRRTGKLPDAKILERRAILRDERDGLSDPVCNDCGRYRSEIRSQRFYFSPHDNGKRYCHDCWVWNNTHTNERTGGQRQKHFHRLEIRLSTDVILNNGLQRSISFNKQFDKLFECQSRVTSPSVKV